MLNESEHNYRIRGSQGIASQCCRSLGCDSYSVVDRYQSFRGTWCHQLQGITVNTLKVEAHVSLKC
jgi:hypothetical protein